MLIPSIDIQDGQAVQLVGGETLAIEAGDPLAVAEGLAVAGEIAVVDLDAALGRGDNTSVIRELCRRHPCRVGGGIRDEDAARRWLDAGARRIVLGTAARPELLARLPRERVVVALDARHGEVVVEGWRTGTGRSIADALAEVRELAGGVLITFVELEGRLGGTALEKVAALVTAAGDARLTIAGGITDADEIARLDALGADAQVGMALYSGRLDLADALAAPLRSDRPDGLWPTVVCDEAGRALGLAWSDAESLREAVRSRTGVYHSRSREGLWRKGASSGATQELLRVDLDCDRDALRFRVRQAAPGFCHVGTRSCWGADGGLPELARRLAALRDDAAPGSYTARLLGDPELLASKLREEADELVRARTAAETVHEAADLLYFTLVRLVQSGVELSAVEAELDRRALQVTRRPGDAKPIPAATARRVPLPPVH